MPPLLYLWMPNIWEAAVEERLKRCHIVTFLVLERYDNS